LGVNADDIKVEVDVFVVDGLELAVGKVGVLEMLEMGKNVDVGNKGIVDSSVWLFDGDYFVVLAYPYTTSTNSRGTDKKPLKSLDPSLLTLTIDNPSNLKPT
jgi:hypothetical protein